MKNNALYVQNEASKRFNPYVLKNFLTRTEDGVVIVDRPRLLDNKDDERLFYVVMNKDYKWNYHCPEDVTIYFEEADGKIYGGIYNMKTGCEPRRIIAVEQSVAKEYDYNLYSYELNALAEIIEGITQS